MRGAEYEQALGLGQWTGPDQGWAGPNKGVGGVSVGWGWTMGGTGMWAESGNTAGFVAGGAI